MSAAVAPARALAPVPHASNEHRRGVYRSRWTTMASPSFDSLRDLQAVALHGMVESPDIWRPTIEQLGFQFCGGYELSMPWHCEEGFLWGLECRPDEWLEPVLADLPAGKRVIFAHSFGANALLSLLQRRPLDDLHALVLLSPYYKPDFEDFSWDLFRRFVGEFEAFVAASIRLRAGGSRISAASLTAVVEKIKQKYGSYGWMEFYQLYARTPTLRLDHLDVPVLILGGDRDLSILPHDLQCLASRLPRARLELLAHCGHFGMVEQPDALVAQIQTFLTELED